MGEWSQSWKALKHAFNPEQFFFVSQLAHTGSFQVKYPLMSEPGVFMMSKNTLFVTCAFNNYSCLSSSLPMLPNILDDSDSLPPWCCLLPHVLLCAFRKLLSVLFWPDAFVRVATQALLQFNLFTLSFAWLQPRSHNDNAIDACCSWSQRSRLLTKSSAAGGSYSL